MELSNSDRFDLVVVDQNWDTVDVIDRYSSLIWTDRFFEAGTFELEMPCSQRAIDAFQPDNYVLSKVSDSCMVVEGVEITTSPDEGSTLKVTGRSLISILDRRVIWDKLSWDNKDIQTIVKDIIDNNCINPTDSKRKLPRFVFKTTSDINVTNHKETLTYFGENVYDACLSVTKRHNVGIRALPTLDGEFVVELYCGARRSWAQDENPWVVFSPDFDNFLGSNYASSKQNYKTICRVYGPKVKYVDEEGTETYSDNMTALAYIPSLKDASGLTRREAFVDAGSDSDVSEEDRADKIKEMQQSGEDVINEAMEFEEFEGEADGTVQFVYGKDFFLGDIVQLQNEWGIEREMVVIEVAHSVTDGGETLIPTFANRSECGEAEE